MASMYAVYHGAEGLAAIARRVNRLATVLAAGLKSLGFAPLSTGFFDTVTVDAGDRAGSIIAAAAAAGGDQIGRAHGRNPVNNAHLVCRIMRDEKNIEREGKRQV